ncbi:MAG: UvrD-helicase domain-containing protein [Desulfococcaceae bacterium]|jgi:uncharacterized protein (TIGR00375 family)|nr:UvrD-helicase domain-containing protein [Desulfococcaceae bacterium]
MKYIADLHVHSRFSRATSKNLNPENLYIHAQLKGIRVVATGDFTHPGWFAELQEKLIPAEPGLYRLKEEIAKECDREIPEKCRAEVRFILECEISNIYKKNGRTRKNHNLIYLPDFTAAARLNARLDNIGNIRSDGRPILGLDARNLLEIMLETAGENAMLVPAHIWTPWFSILGSKSGFDSVEECFADLSHEIFAVETGLSSDASMNRRIAELDSRTLISNSDAHSPASLGRNANLLDTELSFSAIRTAMKTGYADSCLETLDLYPQEGKYHMDGHRKCNVMLHPPESIANGNLCPVCGKELTLGVLHRVEELADRPEGTKRENAQPFRHIIPLPEILSEIYRAGSGSKKVNHAWQHVLSTAGPELHVLLFSSPEEIAGSGIPLLDEALRRMRAGEIHISPGYDGEYGRITVFTSEEKEKLTGQKSLFSMPVSPAKKKEKIREHPPEKQKNISRASEKGTEKNTQKPVFSGESNPEQQKAVCHPGGPLLIIAGPGTGKTRTLTRRIAWLMREQHVPPENILAVTFTNKAAAEMKERVRILLEKDQNLPMIATFHAFAYEILKKEGWADYRIMDEEERSILLSHALEHFPRKGRLLRKEKLSHLISSVKQQILNPKDDLSRFAAPDQAEILSEIYKIYRHMSEREKCLDYDDLIFCLVRLLENNPEIRAKYEKQYAHILIDEYQDVNHGQYRIVRALAPPDSSLCVIGDPDQAIYGFRGADSRYFHDFAKDYPTAESIRFRRNYRSAESILTASQQIIRGDFFSGRKKGEMRIYSGIRGIRTLGILEQATEKAEAVALGKIIEKMCGGTGFHSIDFGHAGESSGKTDRGFSDFAVLYRSHAQGEIIAEVFEKGGIPFQLARKQDLWGETGIAELISFLKLAEDRGIFRDFEQICQREDTDGKIREQIRSHYYDSGGKILNLPEFLSSLLCRPFPGMTEKQWKVLVRIIKKTEDVKEKIKGKSLPEKILFLSRQKEFAHIRASARKGEILKTLMEKAAGFAGDLPGFFAMLALDSDTEALDHHAEKVSLMTLHGAKGLEFPVVFISGCEDGFLPYRHPYQECGDWEEERRLLYVGMTRAKEELFLTRAKKRRMYGKTAERKISPFLKDIEAQLLRPEKSTGKKKKQQQLDIF